MIYLFLLRRNILIVFRVRKLVLEEDVPKLRSTLPAVPTYLMGAVQETLAGHVGPATKPFVSFSSDFF